MQPTDAKVEIAAPSPPMDEASVSLHDLRAALFATRHSLDVRVREVRTDVVEMRADLAALRADGEARRDQGARLEACMLGVAASVARLDRRMAPVAWSGVVLGALCGWAGSSILSELGGSP